MKTKFIENTNQQYSIREDGVITRHYHNSKWKTIVYKNKVLNKAKTYCFNKHNRKGNTFTYRSLMFKYFTITCETLNCNTLLMSVKHHYCNECAQKRLNIINKKYNDRLTKTLTKEYIANQLNIKTKEISNFLYQHHRNTILFKRKLAKKHNISINSIK
jgi:hypothetical protein